MKLHLIVGPMFAGKTSYIIEKFNSDNTLAIKPIIDNRYKIKEIVSHDGKKIPCISVNNLISLNSKINFNEFENIIIDEGQFFGDLGEFINILESYHVNVFIAALNGDFNRKPFKVISNLYARANQIIFKQGRCNFCTNKSCFTWKFESNSNFSGCQIDVGGVEKYQPVCGNCYEDFLKKSVSHKLSVIGD